MVCYYYDDYYFTASEAWSVETLSEDSGGLFDTDWQKRDGVRFIVSMTMEAAVRQLEGLQEVPTGTQGRGFLGMFLTSLNV